ncbi:gamma-tubulin complex component protein, partial [Blyttiomyces helicus]
VTETALLRDVIYVFQGIDGKHLTYDSSSNLYVVDRKLGVPRPLRDLIGKLSEMGILYRRINVFTQAGKENAALGLIGQSFCSALQQELTDYYRLIAVLEGQIRKGTEGDQKEKEFASRGLSLKRVYVWTQEPLHRLRLMSTLVDICADKKGGALISTIHEYVNHGDPFVQQFVTQLLMEVSKPFFEMLKRWVHEGELSDPYDEFFVACNNSFEGSLWRSKYTTRHDMVPVFISKAHGLSKKISSIGKSLNFIRYSCNDHEYVVMRSKIAASAKGFQYGSFKIFEALIESAYVSTNARLLEILYSKYKLMEHFVALKRYLLLGQGDLMQYLMMELGDALSRPATTIYRHNLTAVLEGGVRLSNAQYDDPDILKRLDVRLMEASPGDTGWDVFALDYHVDAPISTIFEKPAMAIYHKLFAFLWTLKRAEHALSDRWAEKGRRVAELRAVREVAADLHMCQIVWAEMGHFVVQLQYFILFEVLECSWDELMTQINKRTGDLDQLISTHNRYLNSITNRCLFLTSTTQVCGRSVRACERCGSAHVLTLYFVSIRVREASRADLPRSSTRFTRSKRVG